MNYNFEKPTVIDTEMKVRALITDIEKRRDKNNKEYWVVRTQLDERNPRTYLAFSNDYNLAPKTLSLLMNYPHLLVNNWGLLTIKKNNDREKVIAIEMDKT